MDIRILQERIEENKKRVVFIFNPTSKDFTITHNDVTYSIAPSAELELPYYTAELFVTSIASYMGSKKDVVVNPAMREEFESRVRLYDKDTVR